MIRIIVAVVFGLAYTFAAAVCCAYLSQTEEPYLSMVALGLFVTGLVSTILLIIREP